jgi:hypothetical protein
LRLLLTVAKRQCISARRTSSKELQSQGSNGSKQAIGPFLHLSE